MKLRSVTVRILLFCLAILMLAVPATATTQVHIVKYASDGKTVLDEATVTSTWMEQNLPVYGDGVTHYYMQGPVFNDTITNKWNPEENDPALLTKDMGAVKGTDIRDLCELAGGASPDDYNITIMASDGFKRNFSYSSVYNPPARAGRMILTWYHADLGYVNGSYSEGMRNVMLADTSTNPWGYHVFGLWDMHESYPEPFWYYYSPTQPSAQGLSVKYVSDILIYSDDPAPVAPVAAFTATPTTGTAPLTVRFTDQSTNDPTSWTWDFGDGNSSWSEQNPVHTYAAAGTYTVTLTATNSAGSDDETKTGYIVVNAPVVIPVAAFAATPTTGTAPLTVRFTDQSTNTPTLWSWDFGDSDTTNATMQNPVHTYAAAGTYAVTLIATNAAGSDSETKSGYITVNAPLPDDWTVSLNGNIHEDLTRAAFESLAEGNRLTYADSASTWSGIALWRIVARVDDTDPATFNNTLATAGYTVTVTAPDLTTTVPSQILANNDTWIVADIVNGSALPKTSGGKNLWPLKIVGPGLSGKQKVGNITVITLSGLPSAPVAAFISDVTSGTAPLTVRFTDQSTNTPTSWSWDFGDGDTTNATAQNPVHTYATAGTYTVTLTAANSLGSDAEIKTGYLTVNSAVIAPVAAFTGTPTTGTAPLTVRFTDQSTNTPTSWSWDFGDGDVTNATVQSPVHTYASTGTYTVTLTATNSAGSDDESKVGYITLTAAPVIDVLFDGTVTLTPGETFTVTAYNNASGIYPVNRTTPLGALDKVATQQGFTYNVTDKKYASNEVLLLDDVGKYIRKQPGYWYAYVNNVYKDGYNGKSYGLNVIELADNDQVDFYYAAGVTNPADPAVVIGNATAAVKIKAYIESAGPSTDVLFDGTVMLTPGEIFTVTAYNNASGIYPVNRTTPLGALDKVATQQGFTYNVTDKKYASNEVLLLDDVGKYIRKQPGYWYAYVNNVYKDGYNGKSYGLNVIELADGDQVNFYYAAGVTNPSDPAVVIGNATAAVKIKVDIGGTGPAPDVLFDGTVTLAEGETFTVVAYNNASGIYTVSRTTPLGALDKVATQEGFTYNVTDKRWQYDQVVMLDDVGQYIRKQPGYWYAYVNNVYKDGYGNHANGLNVIELADNDQVNFYYAAGVTNPSDPAVVIGNATAAVKIKVDIGGTVEVPDWILSLEGAKETTVTQTYFEQGLACSSSGHWVNWTDNDGNVWGGVPLWLLVGMVDDNPDIGSSHFNFNDSIAGQGYSVKVNSGDGWNTTLASADIARNSGYIVANTLNGEPLPVNLTSGKLSWPLHLKGSAVFGGQQVGNITSIELTGLPQPSEGWTLTLEGDVTDVITQNYFEQAIACQHNVTWTDANGDVWEGVPLWDLAGVVDDIETSSHFTFNDTRATEGYTIRVSASDGYSTTFASADAAHNNGYFLAHKLNGAALTGDDAPLKLVGSSTTSGKQRVGNVVKISLEGLPSYPAGDWQLKLVGKISDTIPQSEFEYWVSCHSATYTDGDGNVYKGIPLWRLLGWVDDRIPHGSNGFNDAAAAAGYTVIVKAGDGYAKEFSSTAIGKNDNFIVANVLNDAPLPTDGDHPPYPLRLVGSSATGGNSVGNIVEIELTDFQTPVEAPKLHIIKYDTDGTTVLDETTIDYHYMEANFDVIGDGVTVYKYQGLTLDPNDLWDPTETKGMNPPKVSNAIKGTRVKDLVDLVGGMGTGTEILFIASDGYETKLGYNNIYTNPYVQSQQGDAVLAWYADGQYVPQYSAGMRLFFTPEDHVFGQWNMHEALDEKYWHYNWQDGVQYPSAAGTSNQNVVEIKVYSSPETDWQLELDGTDIGGVKSNISKTYLEQALACQFGSQHKAQYTDAKERVWEGMPLWFFAGFVDDADQHSDAAFNDTLATNGYRVIVTGSDGFSTEIDSRLIVRNSNYIVANSLNGAHIDESDENWPLRLTGANVSGTAIVKKVASIRLMRYGEAPIAAFAANVTSGTVPLTVKFTDQSTGSPTSWSWDFNDDGTEDSTARSPEYTYSAAGTYTVNLTVTNEEGRDSEIKTGYITVTAPAVDEWSIALSGATSEELTRAEFGALAEGNRLTYTDSSGTWSGVALWRVLARVDDADPNTFNDNLAAAGYTVTVAAPDFSTAIASQVLAKNDTWIVADTLDGEPLPKQLSDKNLWPLKIVGTGLSGKQKVANISAITLSGFTAKPTAAFTAAPEYLTVQFTDQSTGNPTSWSWEFGDGSSTTDQNPSHTYATAGTYTVKLTVTNGAGSDVETKDVTVTAAPGVPVAAFSATADYLTVKFTDTSTGVPTAWLWDFGDGSSSTETSPSHTYVAAGTYPVKLTVTNDAGSDDEIQDVTVSSSPAPVTAAFTADTTSGRSPLVVRFTDQSTGNPIEWYWDFGDGKTSRDQNPVHTYTGRKTQSYTVTLTVLGAGGKDSEIKTKYITVNPAAGQPGAEFTADVTSGTSPLKVTFTDQSTGSPTAWYWSFGDGTFSTKQNPVHTYTTLKKEQTYTVSLTVVNAGGKDTETKTKYITVTTNGGSKPEAAFTADVTSGTSPLKVTFTDQSTGSPTAWYWSFGDGTFSTKQNPVHTYTTLKKEQTYAVSLTVVNAGGKDTETKTKYITVTTTGGNKPEAAFAADVTSGTSPLKVTFTDQSTGNPTAWYWSFGDGTFSIKQNPVHTYTTLKKEQTYAVSLTVVGASGKDTETKTKYITVTGAERPKASFTANITSGNSPLAVQFTDQSTGSPTAWYWNFGDGKTSAEQNPVHTYTSRRKNQFYTVQLTIITANGRDSETKTNFIKITTK